MYTLPAGPCALLALFKGHLLLASSSVICFPLNHPAVRFVLLVASDQIDLVIREYLALGPEGRRTDPRIGRDRHALIMSGAAILQALMRIWPTDRLSVADRGLREGLLYAQMSADGVLQDGPYR